MTPFFDSKWKSKDNSHPREKIALREWLLSHVSPARVLDVYGGGGLMFDRVWRKAQSYRNSEGEALRWLQFEQKFTETVFDIDPYASPYEALEIIGKNAISHRIGIVCTDGTLRRAGMRRTRIPKYLQNKCGWPERSLTLMAGIYHQYPRYLRHVLSRVLPQWEIERLAIQYGKGTWKQATVYFAAVLTKRPTPTSAEVES